MSPLIAIFLTVLATRVIAYFGKDAIVQIIYLFYVKYAPTSSVVKLKKQQALQQETLRTKAELAGTSSQDEFAKWAKIRRRLDKQLSELEVLNTQTASFQSSFNRAGSILIWILTGGVKGILRYNYRKEAIFWLPRNVFPYRIEWLLSLPKAPLGSVSVMLWAMVLDRTLSMIFSSVTSTKTVPKSSS